MHGAILMCIVMVAFVGGLLLGHQEGVRTMLRANTFIGLCLEAGKSMDECVNIWKDSDKE
jgi:hypothetical protein